MINQLCSLWTTIKRFDFLAPLAMRLFLAPILWMAGYGKFSHFTDTVHWFGDPDWGLGLPFPGVMVVLAAGTELLGAVCLVLGLAVRWIAIPLMVTMIVAVLTVHWDNGWAVIAGQGTEAAARLHHFMDWLQEMHPKHHEHLTELGRPVILNNGIEFGMTYFIMLLSLFFTGAGQYISLDYWICRCSLKCRSKCKAMSDPTAQA